MLAWRKRSFMRMTWGGTTQSAGVLRDVSLDLDPSVSFKLRSGVPKPSLAPIGPTAAVARGRCIGSVVYALASPTCGGPEKSICPRSSGTPSPRVPAIINMGIALTLPTIRNGDGVLMWRLARGDAVVNRIGSGSGKGGRQGQWTPCRASVNGQKTRLLRFRVSCSPDRRG